MPTEHATQAAFDVAPVLVLYVPYGHRVHADIPVTAAYEPAPQAAQEDAPAALDLPASHATQVPAIVAPAVGLYVPP